MNMVILKGARHPKVYSNTHGWNLFKSLNSLFGEVGRDQQINILSETHVALTNLKLQSGAFAVDERMAIASASFSLIQRLRSIITVQKD